MERTCPKCGKSLGATESRCPHCGEESAPWRHHEGRWWELRAGRWWRLDEATGSWRPHAGPSGVQPESVDTWALLDAMQTQTALLRRTAFWLTVMGVISLLIVGLWVAFFLSALSFGID